MRRGRREGTHRTPAAECAVALQRQLFMTGCDLVDCAPETEPQMGHLLVRLPQVLMKITISVHNFNRTPRK